MSLSKFKFVYLTILITGFFILSSPVFAVSFTRNLSKGSSGSDVRQMQEILKRLGHLPNTVKISDYFGTATFSAVKAYQKAKGLPATGFVGPLTLKALSKETDLVSIFYYRETDRGLESFKKNIKTIDILAPQTYSAGETGALFGSVQPEVLELAKKNNIKVMPLIVNTGFDQEIANKFLSDTSAQDVLIITLIQEAKKYGYYGWQFDFEQMTSEYRDKYSALLARATKPFKDNGLVLSVAVIAQHTEDPNAYAKDLWKRVIGVYDYEALGKATDIVSIMSYDDPHSDGPVAGLPFQKKVLDFALTKMPKEKISLGVPFYWWKWDDGRGKIVDIGGYQRVKELFEEGKYLSYGFSATEKVPWVKYEREGKPYTLWYENLTSFKEKIALARQYGVQGFSAWVLGLEDPRIYSVLD